LPQSRTGGSLPSVSGASPSGLPKRFGRYEVIRELGKGAMGVVYLGRDPVIGRLVALKTIRAVSEDDVEQREFQERFLREAQAAGILSHPNIVTVHDVGEDSSTETSFIAMEYVEGKNLKQLLAEKAPFSFERVAEIIGQVAEALDYAHRRGIVHRDVKPANIIITSENQVKITDFGIAKTEKSNLTTTGQFLGTPNYMSPEQVTGDAVDGRSDLFSLGVVLYELLTRKKPFTADNLTSISYKIVHEQFVPPETYDAAIPPEFAGVLDRALAKDPGERFQRGNDFALSLYEFKAREEERQMLRDLGQMVAEAERLGPVATVTAPPSPPLPSPATPAPAAPPPPAEPRSPFDILAAVPTAPAAPAGRTEDDDLATRQVVRPLPATTYVAPSASASGAGDEAPKAGQSSDEWQLEEPTRSRKKPAPPPAPAVVDVPALDVDASVPGAEIPEVPPSPVAPAVSGEPASRPRGLAVSPFDAAPPPAAGPAGDRPDGATEILQVGGLQGFPPAPASPPPPPPAAFTDRPTEILKAIPPALVESAPPVAPPPAFVDRPTEILTAIPPSALEKPPVDAFVDRPTEILQAITPPAAETPKPPSPPPAPAPVPVTDRPTEILRSPFPPPAPPVPGPAPEKGDAGEEGATERIVDAMKLAAAGAPAAKTPAAPPARRPAPVPAPPPVRTPSTPAPAPRPISSPSLRAPTPTPPPAPLPPAALEPIPEHPPAPPGPPPGPVMKRSVNGRFVALVVGLALVAAAVVAGVLLSRKAAIDRQTVVDEVREREVQELKALMDDAERLLAAGSAEQALEKFREVIRRKPDSSAAREGVARAEEQVRAKLVGAELEQEVENRLAAARAAAETGTFDRALDELSAVLLLQPDNAEALSIREAVKAAQAEKVEADRKAAALLARRRRPTPVPTPVRVEKPVVPVEPPKAATPTPGVARLRIVFQSPAPEGYVMVRRNDKEVFRRQFGFGRKSAGGLVEGTIEVPSGPANFKVWAIPTNRDFNGYKPVDLVVPGGETRTLLLELDAGKNLVVSLR